jgi:hypothetical protein
MDVLVVLGDADPLILLDAVPLGPVAVRPRCGPVHGWVGQTLNWAQHGVGASWIDLIGWTKDSALADRPVVVRCSGGGIWERWVVGAGVAASGRVGVGVSCGRAAGAVRDGGGLYGSGAGNVLHGLRSLSGLLVGDPRGCLGWWLGLKADC